MLIFKYLHVIGCVAITCGMIAISMLRQHPATLHIEESLTWRDHCEIHDLVREKTYVPIGNIKRISGSRVEVMMCASGCMVQDFVLEKRDGHWRRLY